MLVSFVKIVIGLLICISFPLIMVYAQYPVGLNALEQFEALPIFRQGVIAQQLSSSDPLGSDFDNTGYLYIDGSEVVIFDQEGPGCVYRIWIRYMPMTPDRIIHFYFDYESEPRVSETIGNLFSGSLSPFLTPIVGDAATSSGGYYGYLPLPFEQHLKISLEGGIEAHQVLYHQYPPDTEISTFTGLTVPSAIVEQWTNTGSDPKSTIGNITVIEQTTIQPDQTETIFSYTGEGSITGIKLQPNPNTLSSVESLILQFYWDGSAIPQTECSLGSFFGSSLGPATVDALPVGIEGDEYYCFFPMPFWEDVRLEIFNSSIFTTVDVSYEITYKTNPYPEESGYFSVFQRTLQETPLGEDMIFADLSGHGQLAGIIVTLVSPYGQDGVRGDLRCYTDQFNMPILQGTDFDGDFNVGDYFGTGVFSLPVHGVPVFEAAGMNSMSAYRFFLGDLLPFARSIRLSAEHGHANRYNFEYASVVYAYMKPGITLLLTDQLNVGDIADETAHNYSVTAGLTPETHFYAYPGVNDDQYFEDTGRSLFGNSTFDVSIDPDNQGVRLVRRRDASIFPQAASVWVDGVDAGIWWDSDYNFYKRWSDSSFEIPSTFTQGLSQVQITVVSLGNSTWTEYQYWIYSRVPPIEDTNPPDQVNNLTAEALEAGSHLRLEWDPAFDETGVAQYRVYRSNEPEVLPVEEYLLAQTPLSEYRDISLTPGTYYYYIVSAVDFVGNESEPSSEIQQRTSCNYLLEGEWNQGVAFTSGDPFVEENMMQYGENWSNNHQFRFFGDREADFISVIWEVAEADTYDVAGYFTKGPEYGIFSFQIDSIPLMGGYDLYSALTLRSPKVELGTLYLEEGEHYFLFNIEGKHSSSSDYNVGIDNLLLASHYLLPVENEGKPATPVSFSLSQNYPNPFNSSTRINFTLPVIGRTNLVIYDLLGRKAACLVDQYLKPGIHEISWKADRFASGIYFVRLQQGDQIATRKLLLLK